MEGNCLLWEVYRDQVLPVYWSNGCTGGPRQLPSTFLAEEKEKKGYQKTSNVSVIALQRCGLNPEPLGSWICLESFLEFAEAHPS